MDSREDVYELLNEAYGLPYGHGRINVLERAVRIADQHNMTDLAFSARQALCDSASLSGRWELIPIHFPWLLATCDKYPDEYDEVGVVFEYLSATQSLTFFSRVQKEHILAAQNDLEQRFRKLGYDLQEVRRIKFLNAIEMGDFDRGQELLEEMSTQWFIPTAKSKLAQGSYAHRLYSRGWFEILRGNVDDGLADLANVYDHRSPDTIIHGFALAIALPHLLARGTDDEKLPRLAERCKNEVQGRPEMIEPYNDLVQYWARAGVFDEIDKHFLEYVTYGEQVQNELDHLGYLQTARFVVERYGDLDRFDVLRFPKSHPILEDDRTVESVEKNYRQRATELAAAFDERNGNTFYSDRLEKSFSWSCRNPG